MHEPSQFFNTSQLVEGLERIINLPHLRVLLTKTCVLIFQVLLEFLKLNFEVLFDFLLVLTYFINHFFSCHTSGDISDLLELLPKVVKLVNKQVLVHLDPHLSSIKSFLMPLSLSFIILLDLDSYPSLECLDLIVQFLCCDA